jgi:G3E family GTPase
MSALPSVSGSAGSCVPVIVVGGGLGCGKTALLRHLLEQAHGRRLALVVNDFGELCIDGVLLAGAGADVVELANGCVCCATGGELGAALRQLLRSAKAPLDAVLVELSGVADPYPVLRELALLTDQVVLRRVVALIDLEADPASAIGDALMLRRLHSAEAVVLNKQDRAATTRSAEWRRIVTATNGRARVFCTQFGRVPAAALLDAGDGANAAPALDDSARMPSHVAYHSLTLTIPARLERARFEAFLAERCAGVERGKGFVELADGTYVVQGVRGRWTFSPVARSNGAPWNRLVLIGASLDPAALRSRAARLCTDVVHKASSSDRA